MGTMARRDLAASFGIGVLFLLFFHLDHLVASYSGWADPAWWLHLLVDGSYVLIYGALGWLALRGWRLWRRTATEPPGQEPEAGPPVKAGEGHP